ncbi:penicillin-insensitive murein endopeptidase [Teredinibacter sp. KSP-S5-2]|uniref:penicillin-insensitive murein endopeptidase n=1 Tax=Teredinibacter sp. KSP-S5-2 TaxID=3034506 RepID=UPI002934E098|nr:penicillin-insensitive murein endopeptidase [Teredinibacter sp. KSP-S5-2]WNO07954.1 penicillin-insensitive murein endopeptidase [Teredinibacter sp. KSP-S5-2]
MNYLSYRLVIVLLTGIFSTVLLPVLVSAEPSTCYGTTSNGRLAEGVELPSKGTNFVTYSFVARLAGRTYIHSDVRDIIVSTYKVLEQEQPSKVYKYAETGFKNGGKFSPHKTHRNGLSVDFMVPVVDENGKSVHLPTNPLNKLGYNIEFDNDSHYDGMHIDYEAMAAHIVALHQQAKKRNREIWRVIFAPELQPNLYSTKYADYLKSHIQFSKKRSWVRHDEHYHIDFVVPCKQ